MAFQAGAGVVSAGMTIGGNGGLAESAYSAGGLGVATVADFGPKFEATLAGKTIRVVPFLGNVVSAAATRNDIQEMENYYDDCLARKN